MRASASFHVQAFLQRRLARNSRGRIARTKGFGAVTGALRGVVPGIGKVGFRSGRWRGGVGFGHGAVGVSGGGAAGGVGVTLTLTSS